MARVLKHDVHVTFEDLSTVLLKAGSRVPKKLAGYVTNPKAYVVEADDADPTPSGESAAQGYAALTVEELRELLKSREAPSTGLKQELVERLEADDAEKAAEGGNPPPATNPNGEEAAGVKSEADDADPTGDNGAGE